MAELTGAEVDEIERALAALAPVGVTVGALALDARFVDELRHARHGPWRARWSDDGSSSPREIACSAG